MDPFKVTTPEEQKQSLVSENWHKEMARRSNDIIRVTNSFSFMVYGKPFIFPPEARMEMNEINRPTFTANGDYYVTWEGLRHRVPANGTADLVRYIADTYTKDMAVFIINYYIQVEGNKLMTRVAKEKPDVMLDEHLKNRNVWDKMPRTDDETLLTELYQQLQLGMVKEFGKDLTFNITDPHSGEVDLRTPQEKAISSLSNRLIIDTNDVPLPNKAELEKDILNDNS